MTYQNVIMLTDMTQIMNVKNTDPKTINKINFRFDNLLFNTEQTVSTTIMLCISKCKSHIIF